MRQRAFFPLAIVAAVLAGCDPAPETTEQAAIRVPQRDLTLREVPAAPAAVASPIEISRRQPDRATTRPRPARKPAPTSVSHRETPEAAPVPEAAAQAVSEPAGNAGPEPPSDPRELAPGETVTVIPASSGPSVAAEPADEMPSRAGRAIMRGRGGTCRPRGAL
jgi:hypothetical protein